MAVQKPKDVVLPYRRSEVAERVTFLPRAAKRRVNLHLERLAGSFHDRAENLRRRQVPIVLRLEKEDWRLGVLNGAFHPVLQRRSERPTFRASSRIDRRAIALALGSENCLDASKRVSRDGNSTLVDERLFPQPLQRGELIIQMIGFQQLHHLGGTAATPPCFFAASISSPIYRLPPRLNPGRAGTVRTRSNAAGQTPVRGHRRPAGSACRLRCHGCTRQLETARFLVA